MKQTKIIKYILIIVITIISLFSAKILLSFIPENENNSEIEESQVIQDGDMEEIDQDSLLYTEETIGKLKIPKLEIEAEIKEGICCSLF